MKYSRELVVGLMFILALAVFIWGYNFLKGMDVFTKEKVIYGVYDKVGGLVKSNPVSINGLKIGRVKDLYFEQNLSGNIIVEMAISSDFPIPRNSVAKIFSSDLMGSKAIEIILGNAGEYINNGDTLFTGIEAGIKEEVNRQVQPLKRKAENLIISIDSMVTAIQSIFNENARENLISSFASIENTFSNLQHATYKIDTFLLTERNHLSKIIYNIEVVTDGLMENKANIDRTLQNLAVISDSLAAAEIPASFAKARQSLEELSDILAKVNNAEGSLGLLLNDKKLYDQLNETTLSLKALVDEIKANPKKFVKFSVF